MIIEIPNKSNDQRIDKFLSDYLSANYPNEKYRNLLSRNHVKEFVIPISSIDGKVVKPAYRLRENDEIIIDDKKLSSVLEELYIEKVNESTILPEEGDLRVVYECGEYMVVDKPSGLVVHPGIRNRSGTLANYVRFYLEQKGEYDPLVERAGIVHRLDKGVSGLMVIPKSREMQLNLKKQFEGHKVLKIYAALTDGIPEVIADVEPLSKGDLDQIIADWSDDSLEMSDKWVFVEGSICRDPKNRKKMMYSSNCELEGGKYAAMYFGAGKGGDVLIRIVTGRMHQIRATLESHNSTVVGDSLYEGKGIFPDRIELRSTILGFKDQNEASVAYCLE